MLKKQISLLLTILMLIGAFAVMPIAASAATNDDLADTAADTELSGTGLTIPTETVFVSRLAQLKEKYYPNGYSGAYYENGSPMAWQCYGYAVQMFYDVFGVSYYAEQMYNKADYTMGELSAGDIVRIRYDSHSIFITKVTDEGYYFTDANWDYNNGVRWDAYYTKAEMAATFTYKIHVPGNTLTGTGVARTGLYMDTPQLKGAKCSAPGITVYWYPVADAAAYRIYYKGGEQRGWKCLGETENTYYKFLDDPVLGTDYTFTVRCIDVYGELVSGFDRQGVTATYSVVSPKLTSADASYDKIALTWDPVSTVKYYRVYAKAETDARWRALANVKGTSYNYTAGKTNTRYQFTVRCLNDKKQLISGCSNTLSAVYTSYAYQLDAPANIVPTAATKQGNIKITWDPVENGKYYMVFYKRDGVSTGWKKLGVTTNTHFYHTGCENNTVYRYTVRCVDAKNAFISDYFREGAPIRFYHFPEHQRVAKHNENGGVQVAWSAVEGASSYAVYYKTATSGGWKRIVTKKPITGRTCIFNGCENGVQYTFTVRACDENGALISSFDYRGVSIVYEGNPPTEPETLENAVIAETVGDEIAPTAESETEIPQETEVPTEEPSYTALPEAKE